MKDVARFIHQETGNVIEVRWKDLHPWREPYGYAPDFETWLVIRRTGALSWNYPYQTKPEMPVYRTSARSKRRRAAKKFRSITQSPIRLI